MAYADIALMYSQVKGGVTGGRTFGFLPPHGRRLAKDEVFVCFGDIRQAIIQFDRVSARRSILAFERAVEAGALVIVSTPSPILQAANGDACYLATASGGSTTPTTPVTVLSTSEYGVD